MKRCVMIIAVFVLLAVGLVALIPPLSKEALQSRSDVIIEGMVSRIDRTGGVFYDRCYGWQRHRAVVLVEKTDKGPGLPPAIVVEYDTRVVNTKGCVGGRDSYTLVAGQRYRMYLKKSAGRPGHFGFFHWMCLRPVR